MKVLLFSKYSRLGASSRLRTMQFINGLNDAGIEVECSSLFDDAYLSDLYSKRNRKVSRVLKSYFNRFIQLFTVKKYDLIWLEYELFPYFPAWFEQWLRWRGIPYIVDYDDAIFHHYDLSTNPYLKLLRRKINTVMANASAVIAGNDYLAKYAVDAGCSVVHVMPTVVDLQRYPKPSLSQPLILGRPFRIGWIGSPATQHYLMDVAKPLQKFLTKYRATLVLIGADQAIRKSFSNCAIEILPWKEQSEVTDICTFDIGIMPLKDGPWERGKCGYKLVQYMACGVPVIASSIGANNEIVNNSHAGVLAENDADWLATLEEMLMSDDVRHDAGQAGRISVETYDSVQAQLPRLIELFKSLHRTSGT